MNHQARVLPLAAAAIACAGATDPARQPQVVPSSSGTAPAADTANPPESPDGAPDAPGPGTGDPPLDERTAYEKAKPVFDAHCSSCHTTSGSKSGKKALSHFTMDAYPFGGHHTATMSATIREVLGATGSAPTMPRDKPGAVKGEELKLVLAWADAYDRAHSGGEK